MSKEAYDTSGDIYPIWGTCLGFEMLALLGNDGNPNLMACEAYNQTSQLDVHGEGTADYFRSLIIDEMPATVMDTLTQVEAKATMNFHHWCLTAENFTQMQMERFFLEPTFWSTDEEGLEYVAVLEVGTSLPYARVYVRC